ncbi:PREDICTED: uncharacterized protein LOC107528387 [Miniopterus natalensis]|uniref:uncharacterized protein LOC107528387 n=1 Tax=Miniopterus natalensis TaxID=291302 RepID=UPI0007A6F6E5|nr:PREDICTED: uncharacterized protein LOC107528387 [Miniopterus natalensis]
MRRDDRMASHNTSRLHFPRPRERRKEHRKHEELPEGRAWPRGRPLQKGDGAQTSENKTKEAGGDQSTKEGPFLSKTEPRRDTKACHFSPRLLGTDWKLPIPPGPVYPPLIPSLSTSAVGRSWELSPPLAKSFQIHDQGPFWHFLDMKAAERLAGWKERRSRYGDINRHECYQLGRVFAPFRALATTELRGLALPQHLPMSLHMCKMGVSCANERDLQDLPLSPTELDLEKGGNSPEKEKAVSHSRTPLFPPIVKATNCNSMK